MKGFGTFFSFAFAAVAAASNVVDLTPKNFDEIVLKSGKPALVEFFAPWCGHCKKLAPVWEELADSFATTKDKVTIAKVDADEHKSLGQKYGIKGFPTIKYFDGKSNKPIDYDSKRDLESLQQFIAKQSNVKAKVKKELPSDVVALNDASFDSVVNGDKHVLVEFYAPWCGHCKALAPVYETLAHNFVNDADVVIAKVDCDSPAGKATAQRFGVTGYPTLKFFPKGATEPIPYEGGRTEQALIEFLNKNAGTARAVGGGLNSEAGRIAAFDKEIKQLVKGDSDSLKIVSEKVLELAEDSKEVYATYYVKALSKLAKKGDYIEKELQRLQGILKRGGLQPKKMDELKSKANILAQFFTEKPEEDTTKEDAKDEL
ncbi:putative disulfide isomerase [Sphaerosporella brunnea]|uniref:protein disulfide-isomerase n=1 Tax=Sphaerosporella brunnea TaxID=1250544 RepID=A0A5J5FAZ0_9PEZI|nr:putative disulfide isomerase [Sphaerosporella brunnea]